VGLAVPGVAVGVVLHGQPAVGLLERLLVGVPGDLQDLVVTPLGRHLPLLGPGGPGAGAAGGPNRSAPSPPRQLQRTAPCTLLPGSSSSILVTITSVVSINPAMLAAFASADFVTLVGSTMPASNMSTYSPVLALYPIAWFCAPRSITSEATTAPS